MVGSDAHGEAPVALRQYIGPGLPTYLVEQAVEGGCARGLLSSEQAEDF